MSTQNMYTSFTGLLLLFNCRTLLADVLDILVYWTRK